MSFEKPQKVTDVQLVFPAGVSSLMPKMEDIPDEFKSFSNQNPYIKFQSKWFFEGLSSNEIPEAKGGIVQEDALRHLAAIQASFEPKHEHKTAAVAYLASLWLHEPQIA